MILHPQQPLYVYELKGGVPPAFLQLEGLLGVWPEAEYTYLFFTDSAEEALEEFLHRHPEFHLTGSYKLRYGDWQQLAEQQPFVVDRFKIVTGNRPVPLSPGDIVMRLDPGVIFGSGLHPTTRGCLRALSRLYAKERPSRVLDLGTGTGILAIAAALLGAREVEALDLNPMAVSTAVANCRRNGVANRVRVRLGDACDSLPEADLLCINIHVDFLRDFFNRPEAHLYRRVIVGGFLQQKLSSVLGLLPAAAKLEGPTILERDWVTVTLGFRG